MRTPRALRPSAVLCLIAMAVPSGAAAADPELSLADAARQALESNLELAALRRALEAKHEEVGIARSALLPQVTTGARAQLLDDDRSDAARGNNTQESILVAAGLNQVLYDETKWAEFGVQKHLYDRRVHRLEVSRLDVIANAGNAFLELDRSRAVLEIQERNRELTRRNLEVSRARIAAGWSSEREVLRWESQLAGNDRDVRSAEVLVLQSRFELNKVRNRSPEQAITPLPAGIEQYGFVYATEAIAQAVAAPEADRRMRDFLVRVGLSRQPELAAFDANIAATERELTKNRRLFWVPSLSFAAGIDYLASSGSSSADFNETEWGIKGVLDFPVVEGGAKFARLRRSGDLLASLRTERRAISLNIEQRIRADFAQASGSYAIVDYTRRQVEAARRNYELVEASYVLGVDSIILLLDAQNQLLTAEVDAVNALYGFLEDLVSAERQLAFFPFLEPPGDVQSLLDSIERQLGLRP